MQAKNFASGDKKEIDLGRAELLRFVMKRDTPKTITVSTKN
jgi:hypothetical protein